MTEDQIKMVMDRFGFRDSPIKWLVESSPQAVRVIVLQQIVKLD